MEMQKPFDWRDMNINTRIHIHGRTHTHTHTHTHTRKPPHKYRQKNTYTHDTKKHRETEMIQSVTDNEKQIAFKLLTPYLSSKVTAK